MVKNKNKQQDRIEDNKPIIQIEGQTMIEANLIKEDNAEMDNNNALALDPEVKPVIKEKRKYNKKNKHATTNKDIVNNKDKEITESVVNNKEVDNGKIENNNTAETKVEDVNNINKDDTTVIAVDKSTKDNTIDEKHKDSDNSTGEPNNDVKKKNEQNNKVNNIHRHVNKKKKDIKEKVLVYSHENLDSILQSIINDEADNQELTKEITEELAKKNLNINLVVALFSDNTVSLEELKIFERMAITKACHKILGKEELNFERNFDDSDRLAYESYTSMEEIIKELRFEYIQRVDRYNYIGRISNEQIYKYMKSYLMRYNRLSQRAYKIKLMGTKNDPLRTIDVNQDNVDEMTGLIIDNDLEETQIILNIRLADDGENFEPNYKFVPLTIKVPDAEDPKKFKLYENLIPNIGTLIIKPEYNLSSPRFTTCEILDGYHRILSVIDAVEAYKNKNNGQYPDGGLDVRIVCRTLTEAQTFIGQIFKRADTKEEFLKGLKHDSYTDFIDLMVDKSKVLKRQTAISYDDHLIDKKLAYKTILVDSLALTNIPVQSDGKVRSLSQRMAKTIDIMVDLLMSKFDDDISRMKKESSLLDCNAFVGYFSIAHTLENIGDDSKLEEIAEKLYENSQEDEKFKKLQFKNKPNNYNYKDIYNYFANVVLEVYNVG